MSGRPVDAGSAGPPPQFETLLTDLDKGVLTVTLNRPDRLNAVTDRVVHELIRALDFADADDRVNRRAVTRTHGYTSPALGSACARHAASTLTNAVPMVHALTAGSR